MVRSFDDDVAVDVAIDVPVDAAVEVADLVDFGYDKLDSLMEKYGISQPIRGEPRDYNIDSLMVKYGISQQTQQIGDDFGSIYYSGGSDSSE